MTEPERRALRQAIDAAKRQQVAHDSELRECAYCGVLFTPATTRQRFCRHSHRVNHHRKTPVGRAMYNAYRRRRARA